MMRQLTFSNSGFEVHRKSTRRERFLAEMEAVVLRATRKRRRLCCLMMARMAVSSWRIAREIKSASVIPSIFPGCAVIMNEKCLLRKFTTL